ncbi:DUF692 domain-containing protein [Chitinophagaceae bacterium LWZ2-11]
MNQFAGIGFRKDFAAEFLERNILQPSFIEVAPENWMGLGGYWKKIFKKVTEQYPLTLHGLSLSIGSNDEPDWDFLHLLKAFIKEYDVQVYSEHLSFSKCDNAHLYELLPIPFREEAVHHISRKINRVQDFLERPLVLEIVSYYTPIAAEMQEFEFINAIVNESGCQLLLDVNNIYVNGFNHKYDPYGFIDKLPLDKVAYIHMAGHEQVADDLIIDTHSRPIINPVFDLFEYSLQQLPHRVPVLLERDFNIPELPELQIELEHLENLCKKHWKHETAAA